MQLAELNYFGAERSRKPIAARLFPQALFLLAVWPGPQSELWSWTSTSMLTWDGTLARTCRHGIRYVAHKCMKANLGSLSYCSMKQPCQ